MTKVDLPLDRLVCDGLLLQQDKRLPSVVGLIVGGPLAGSWWGHPKGRLVFRCLRKLVDHPDVLATRLIAGKVTYLHRRLWLAFLAVATSGEPWQLRRLPTAARKLLRDVESGKTVCATGKPARELQERLLVHAEEVHTESGQHDVLLRPWRTMRRSMGRLPRLSVATAREQLERAALAIGAQVTGLPWRRFAK